MGKHTPLPSDPIDRATEKRRRFKAYQKDWKQRRRAEAARAAISNAKVRRALLIHARQANIDLCLFLDDMSEGQLRRALRTVQEWTSEL
jgi:hypothetical protein